MKYRILAPTTLLVGLFWLALSPAARAETALSLEQRLEALVLDWQPSGDGPGAAVLVMVDGKPVLRKGYGKADLATGEKIAPDTIFRVGSITKQFTAVAVLQLVQQGKISLDDPITKHLPDFDTQGKTITIENLLSHTSGLPNYTATPAYDEGMTRDLKPAEILGMVAGKPLEFDPGTRFRYSNTNYVLLGMVIEKASGQTYAEYLDEHIAKPLGLVDTGYSRTDALSAPRHARGYDLEGGKWVIAAPLSMTQPFAAGAVESTVDDLAKWTIALAAGKVVDPGLLERAWTPFKPTEKRSDYGYGWSIRKEPGERWIAHGGGINGFASDAVWIPEKRVYVAVLRNGLGDAAPEVLVRQLALEAVGRPAPRRVAITLPAETLDRYVGTYSVSAELRFTVTREGEKLFVAAPNKSNMEVFAESADRFFSRQIDAQFAFEVENGKATKMVVTRNGREMPARRDE